MESEEKLTWRARLDRAWASVKEIVGKVWLYVVIGIAVGAGIHGYVPERALADIMGRYQWWSSPAARAQAAVDCRVCRRDCDGQHHYWLFV